jgi:glucose-1-phosphate cytidylyltransferase
MKAVILAGGRGSRLSEETTARPKPMVEVGGMPILWHVMKIYAAHGIEDFIICLGYKGYLVKEWFANYSLYSSDVTFDMRSGEMLVHRCTAEPWRVTLVDTGAESMTGGRLRRVLPFLGDEDFCFTYGDGVGDVDVTALIAFHRAHGRRATLTAVRPDARFGALTIDGARVTRFEEKPRGDGNWTNGGFFVLDPSVAEHLHDDATVWEQEPVRALAAADELACYAHHGFWLGMDTLRDKHRLQELWESDAPPWKVWDRVKRPTLTAVEVA